MTYFSNKANAYAFIILSAVLTFGCGQPSPKATTIATPVAAPKPNLAALETEELFGAAEAGSIGHIEIYNASLVATIPTPLYAGVKVLKDSELTLQGTLAPLLVTEQVHAADKNLTATRDFYRDVFQRLSYDGQGAKIKASVEVQRFHLVPVLGLKNNAAWMQPFKMFIFGAGGDELGGFAEALDVVGHEFTHAVIGTTSNLEYAGQSGALNEHLADVFGEIIQNYVDPSSEPFLIGETVLRGDFAQQARALRDMLNPAQGLSPQPGHMSEIPAEMGPDCQPTSTNDQCGVHTLSGIPNRAAALIIQALGWQESYQLFYKVMTERLSAHSNFADYRSAMVDECRATMNADACAHVEAAFADVGL